MATIEHKQAWSMLVNSPGRITINNITWEEHKQGPDLPQSRLVTIDSPGRTNMTPGGRRLRKALKRDRQIQGVTGAGIDEYFRSSTHLLGATRQELSQPGERELAMWEAVAEFLTDRKPELQQSDVENGLNVLIVNQGTPDKVRGTRLVASLAAYRPESKFTLVGNPLGSLDIPAITEEAMKTRPFGNGPKPKRYDLVLVLNDDPQRDKRSEELFVPINTTNFARILTRNLNPSGRIVISANENLDGLRKEILDVALSTGKNVVLRGYPDTVYKDTSTFPETLQVLENPKLNDQIGKRIVWSIGREYEEQEHKDLRRYRARRKKRGLIVTGSALLAAGVAAGAFIATSSSGQALLSEHPHCDSGQIAVSPSQSVITGAHAHEVFQLPGGINFTVDTVGKNSSVTYPSTSSKHHPFDTPELIITPPNKKITVYVAPNGNDLSCISQTPPATQTQESPTPTPSASSGGASIPGATAPGS